MAEVFVVLGAVSSVLDVLQMSIKLPQYFVSKVRDRQREGQAASEMIELINSRLNSTQAYLDDLLECFSEERSFLRLSDPQLLKRYAGDIESLICFIRERETDIRLGQIGRDKEAVKEMEDLVMRLTKNNTKLMSKVSPTAVGMTVLANLTDLRKSFDNLEKQIAENLANQRGEITVDTLSRCVKSIVTREYVATYPLRISIDIDSHQIPPAALQIGMIDVAISSDSTACVLLNRNDLAWHRFSREVVFLYRLRSTGIVPEIKCIADVEVRPSGSRHVCYVTERWGDTLYCSIRDGKLSSSQQKLRVMFNLIRRFQSIHSRDMLLRIFSSHDVRVNSALEVKLCAFRFGVSGISSSTDVYTGIPRLRRSYYMRDPDRAAFDQSTDRYALLKMLKEVATSKTYDESAYPTHTNIPASVMTLIESGTDDDDPLPNLKDEIDRQPACCLGRLDSELVSPSFKVTSCKTGIS